MYVGYKVCVCVCVFSRSAVNVVVRVTMPKSTTSVSCEPLSSGQRYEYKPQEKQFTWTIKKMQGGNTCECKAKVHVYVCYSLNSRLFTISVTL